MGEFMNGGPVSREVLAGTGPGLTVISTRSKVYKDYGTWTLEEYLGDDPLAVRTRVSSSRLTPLPINRKNWRQEVLRSVTDLTLSTHDSGWRNNRKVVPLKSLAGKTEAAQTLRTLFDGELKHAAFVDATQGGVSPNYTRDKRNLLVHMADDIERNNRYGLIEDMWNAVSRDESDDAWQTKTLLGTNLRALLLLVGNSEKVLAGFQGSTPLWKKVELPRVYDELGLPIYHISSPFMELLGVIKDRELVRMFPKKLPQPEEITTLRVPRVNGGLREILWDTHQNQRYVLHPEILPTVLRGESDVRRLLVLEVGGWLFTKTETSVGDFTTAIYIDRAGGFSSDSVVKMFGDPQNTHSLIESSELARLAADARRTLLCARVVVKPTRGKSGKRHATETSRGGNGQGTDKDAVQLAQNVIYVYEDGSAPKRSEYDGPKRQVEPHPVKGYVRKAGTKGMSPNQRREVREWMLRHRISAVPKPGPKETLVLPYYVPSGDGIDQMPTYKREDIARKSFGNNGLSTSTGRNWVGVEYFSDESPS